MYIKEGNHARAVLACIILGCMLGLASSARAAVYRCEKDFSTVSNPNGVWSYGSEPSLTGAFTLYTSNCSSIIGMSAWVTGCYPADPPFVAHNNTISPICYLTFCVPKKSLHLHPAANGDFDVVRFKAPKTGAYKIFKGFFVGLDIHPTSTDVYIVHNSTLPALFTGAIASYSLPLAFGTLTVPMNAGDTLDFAVGYGSNLTYDYDSTGLDCVIVGP